MPVSMRLGWRLRHTRTAVPNALRPKASSKKRMLLTALTRASTSAATSGTPTSCASSPHAEPPAHVSRFQIGTDDFNVSMQNRAAWNASSR